MHFHYTSMFYCVLLRHTIPKYRTRAFYLFFLQKEKLVTTRFVMRRNVRRQQFTSLPNDTFSLSRFSARFKSLSKS